MLSIQRLGLLRQLSFLKTISAVAEAEGLTRPAVSQQLAQLEAETGLALLERAGRNVRLTGSARALLDQSRGLFEALEGVEAHLDAQRHGVAGEIRISGFSSVAINLIPGAVAHLREAHPGLQVRMAEQEPNEAYVALAGNKADIAMVDDLMAEEYTSDILDNVPFITDRLYAVLPDGHPLADRADIDLAELAGSRWAMSVGASRFTAYVTNACRTVGFEPNVVSECRQAATVLEMVRAGMGVSVLPGLSLVRLPEGITAVPLTDDLPRHIYIAFRRGRADRPTHRAAIEALFSSARALASSGLVTPHPALVSR